MAETVSNLLNEIQRAVDVDQTRALTLLNRTYRGWVSRARAYRRTVSLGNTSPNVRDYALPTDPPLVELYEVLVDGRTYGQALHKDIASYAMGWLVLSDDGGVIAPEESSTGASEIALIPTPSSVMTLEVRGAWMPPELVLADPATAIRVDHDLQGALIEGSIATELRIIGEGDPTSHEAVAQVALQEFMRRVRRRTRGAGPAQIRVQGVNA